jgi:predicted nucleic acid-binding protein
MYLLDTNVVSEIRRARPHGAVVAWVTDTPNEDMFLSAVTLGEIQYSIEALRPRDAEKAAELEGWADGLAARPNLLPMSVEAFRLWARLMQGRPDELCEDAMLAATALVHGLTMVTRNVRDFAGLGVEVFNPFQYQSS